MELYRGACQTEDQIQEYKDAIGKTRMYKPKFSLDDKEREIPFTMSLFGFTSTSLDRDAAQVYAKGNDATGMKPVLYVFKWAFAYNYYLTDMSPYSDEVEVL